MSEARKKEGCRSCKVAFRKKGELVFLAPENIDFLEELSYSYKYAEASNFADNIQNIYRKKPTGAEITLTFSDIKSKMLAKILGKKYVKGGYTTNTEEKPEPVAILFQETYNDGSYINTVFYNVKFARDENSAKTSSDNIEFTPITFKGMAIPFTNEHTEGDIDFRMDSAGDEIDKAKLDAFFKAVQYLNGEVQVATTVESKEE